MRWTALGLAVLTVGGAGAFRPRLTNQGARVGPVPSFAHINNEPAGPRSPRDAMNKQVSEGMKTTAALGAFAAALGSEVQAARADVAGGTEMQFITTASGLKYSDAKVGDGATPTPGDTVRVHYTGWLDGFDSEKKFDSSYDRRSPLVFRAGVGQVVKGWDEALMTDMKVGTVRYVIIPAELGYGARGAGGVIPANAVLYFKMELLGIGAR